jgi:triacylglycerol lipase
MQVHYWRNVRDILRNTVGAEVFFTSVPPCISPPLRPLLPRRGRANRTTLIVERAQELDRALSARVYGRGVNLMAHSMGGRDLRYLISKVRSEESAPLSLTTISTPHHGSPFMDRCAVRA